MFPHDSASNTLDPSPCVSPVRFRLPSRARLVTVGPFPEVVFSPVPGLLPNPVHGCFEFVIRASFGRSDSNYTTAYGGGGESVPRLGRRQRAAVRSHPSRRTYTFRFGPFREKNASRRTHLKCRKQHRRFGRTTYVSSSFTTTFSLPRLNSVDFSALFPYKTTRRRQRFTRNVCILPGHERRASHVLRAYNRDVSKWDSKMRRSIFIENEENNEDNSAFEINLRTVQPL